MNQRPPAKPSRPVQTIRSKRTENQPPRRGSKLRLDEPIIFEVFGFFVASLVLLGLFALCVFVAWLCGVS